MLVAAKHAYGARLEGSDGRAGTLYDILFDDTSWSVRHLVVSVDRWFHGRQVLIEPGLVRRADWPNQQLLVPWTKEQIRQSPPAEADLSSDERRAREAAQMLVWEAYWAGVLQSRGDEGGDANLHSTKMLSGLHIHCVDGMLGHVDDFIIDDQTWQVRGVIVETRNWWPGKHVFVELHWIDSIHWEDGQIYLKLTRENILKRPAYDGNVPQEDLLRV